ARDQDPPVPRAPATSDPAAARATAAKGRPHPRSTADGRADRGGPAPQTRRHAAPEAPAPDHPPPPQSPAPPHRPRLGGDGKGMGPGMGFGPLIGDRKMAQQRQNPTLGLIAAKAGNALRGAG